MTVWAPFLGFPLLYWNGILLRSGLNLACQNWFPTRFFVVWNWNLLRTFWGFFWECFWFFFEIFRRKIEKKLQKHSKKNLKRFETISFLDDQKIELRTVGKRDQAAMQQLSLLNFWASARPTAPRAPACYWLPVPCRRQLCELFSSPCLRVQSADVPGAKFREMSQFGTAR